MRRGLAAAVAVLGLMAAPPAGADVLVGAPGGGKGVATCLRDAGAGEVTLFGAAERRSAVAPIDLRSGDDLRQVAQARLGRGAACPEVARGGDVTVLASLATDQNDADVTVSATVRDGAARPFGAPVTLARLDYYSVPEIAVAVGPRGDAVIAWSQGPSPLDPSSPTGVMAVRRPPGGDWGAPVAVLPPADLDATEFAVIPIAAGVDAAGRVTVAAGVPLGRQEDVFRVEVATAAPGAPFGPRQRLSPATPAISPLAMAVAPNGRTLVAAPGAAGLLTWERAPGAGPFGGPAPLAEDFDATSEPTVALRDDGGAAVAYRYYAGDREGVALSRRLPGRAFTPPDSVWSRAASGDVPDRPLKASRRARPRGAGAARVRAAGSSGGSISFGIVAVEDDAAPFDAGRPRVALGADGRLSLTATVARERRPRDAVNAPLIVAGSLGGALSVAVRGSPCRATNGNAAFIGRDGAPRGAWTDNASTRLGEDFELPESAGRAHVARLDQPPTPAAAAPSRPRIVGPRRRVRLYGAQALKLRVACDGPCDLRASIRRGGRPRAAAGASLEQAGTATLTLPSADERPVAPSRPATLPVVVDSCAPDGGAVATTRGRVKVARRRPPPVPRPVRVRARRSGKDVVVTWRTRRPARRMAFVVLGADPERDEFDVRAPFEYVEGRGRRSFRVRLRSVGGYRIPLVVVGANPYDPPFSRAPGPVLVRVRR